MGGFDDRTVKISRKELYEQVWAEPMIKLAKRYHLSDVGLAKICRKYRIPRPYRGYWAQKQSGQAVRQVRLENEDADVTIWIYLDPDRCSKYDRLRGIVAGTGSRRRKAEKIAVPDTLADPHHLILQTDENLKSRKPEPTGVVARTRHCLDITVSPGNLERALLVFDTLLKALEQRSYVVSVSQGSTSVRIGKARVCFGLREELRPTHLRAQDHELGGYYQFDYNQYAKYHIPSGRLIFFVNDSDQRAPMRKVWRDSETHRVEDLLDSLVSGLIKMAAVQEAKGSERKDSDESGPDV